MNNRYKHNWLKALRFALFALLVICCSGLFSKNTSVYAAARNFFTLDLEGLNGIEYKQGASSNHFVFYDGVDSLDGYYYPPGNDLTGDSVVLYFQNKEPLELYFVREDGANWLVDKEGRYPYYDGIVPGYGNAYFLCIEADGNDPQPWGVGNHTFRVYVKDYSNDATCFVSAQVKSNPIQSVSYIPKCKTISLQDVIKTEKEARNQEWTSPGSSATRVSHESGLMVMADSNRQFYYAWSPAHGDVIKITSNGQSTVYTYDFFYECYDEQGNYYAQGAFLDNSGKPLETYRMNCDAAWADIFIEDQSLTSISKAGTYTLRGKYCKKDLSITIQVVDYSSGGSDNPATPTSDPWGQNDEWSFKNYSAKPIKLTPYDYNKLTYNATPAEKERINNLLATSGEGGQCYGMAVTSVLAKEGVLMPKDMEYGLSTLYQAKCDGLIQSVIGYHFLNQFTQDIQKAETSFSKLSLKEQLNKLVSMPKPFLLGFGADGWGAHAVVATGSEKGSWTYHNHNYDTRIKIYDSNSPLSSGNSVRKDSYLYFNSSTLEWEIPKYYSSGTWPNEKKRITSDGNGHLSLACEDTSIMNNLQYKARNTQYETWIRTKSYSEAHITDGEKTYSVAGEIRDQEEISAYYDMGILDDSEFVPTINIMFPEAKNLSIQSTDEKDLDINVLYPECNLSATADRYSNVKTYTDGEIEVIGANGDYDLTVTSDDDSLKWETVEVSGSDSDNIRAKITDDGAIIRGTDLDSTTFTGTNDKEIGQVTFNTDKEEVLISMSGENLEALADLDGDGDLDDVIARGQISCNHNWEQIITKATLSSDGNSYYKCSNCGAEKDQEIIAKVNELKLSPLSYTYNGKEKKPTVSVTDADGETIESSNYSVVYSNNLKAGKATAKITFRGDFYSGSEVLVFTINKAAKPLSITAKTASVRYGRLQKKNQTLAVTKVIKFTKKDRRTKSYKLKGVTKSKFKKYFRINAKTGKVTVKKGLRKGTYKIRVKITAAENNNYKKAAKSVTFKIRVK